MCQQCIPDCNCNPVCACDATSDCGGAGMCIPFPSPNGDVGVCAAQEGDSCGGFSPSPLECGPGLVCTYPTPSIPDLPGVCTRLPVCALDADCDGNTYCSLQGHCTPFAGCDLVSDCDNPANMFSVIECVGAMLCIKNQCEKQCGDEQAPCWSDVDCGSGMVCSEGGVCVLPPMLAQCTVNECPDVHTDNTRLCDDGTNANWVCASVPYGPDPDPLSSDDNDRDSYTYYNYGYSKPGALPKDSNPNPSCQWLLQCPSEQPMICADGVVRRTCDGDSGDITVFEEPVAVTPGSSSSETIQISLMAIVPVVVVLLVVILIRCHLHRRLITAAEFSLDEPADDLSYTAPQLPIRAKGTLDSSSDRAVAQQV